MYQWIPASESVRDYFQRVYELVAAIAEVEDRYAGDVLSDILHKPLNGVTNGVEASFPPEHVAK